jgi:hypothetical protein
MLTWLLQTRNMNLHKEWFCKYEKLNGCDFFLGDDLKTIIIGHGRVKLLLKDGRNRTLLGIFHVPELDTNFIFVSKMSDIGL